MLANITSLFTAFCLIGTAAARLEPAHARTSEHHIRQAAITPAQCQFVLQPTTFVDANSASSLAAEFQVVTGFALSEAASENIFPTDIVVSPSSGGAFRITGQFGSETKTPRAINSIVGGWVGKSREGISATWMVKSATCA